MPEFTPVQVSAIRSGLSPGLTVVVGPPGTGKTDTAVSIITNLFRSFPTQRTLLVTHSNAALNDLFEKIMATGVVDERYMIRLGSGEKDLNVQSTHDFTKQGRVRYTLSRRASLLGEVQLLSESLGVSSVAERGAAGESSYTCETAMLFHTHHVRTRVQKFLKSVEEGEDAEEAFPFAAYYGGKGVSFGSQEEAEGVFQRMNSMFEEVREAD